MKKIFYFAILLLFFSSPLFAGGPWFVDVIENSGKPARWPYDSSTGKWVMRWKVDPGPLTEGISFEEARAEWIQPMLDDWKGITLPFSASEEPVPTVALEFIFEGEVAEDVTVENYRQYVDDYDPARPPPTVVIFDVDGSIIEAYCLLGGGSTEKCQENRNRIAGMGLPFLDGSARILRHGFIFLNGRLINGNAADGGEMDPERFKSVIKHEFGHLLNLDHAQVNAEIALGCREGSCEEPQGVGTMFPESVTTDQYTLHRDDKVTASWLYPTQAFRDKFCLIEGEIQDADGKGLQGVNVIARSVNNPAVDARAMVSGVRYAPYSDHGEYTLSGIIPGEAYEVVYEELLSEFNNQLGSEFGPLEADSPTGFEAGVIEGPDGEATIKCNQGGETIQMPPLKISMEEGRAISGAVSEATPQTGGDKKGWCQLMVGDKEVPGTFGAPSPKRARHLFVLFSLVLILFAFRLHLKRAR